MALTGRFNLRKTLFGKIVLQVEEDVKASWPMSLKRSTRRHWRDAKVMDLARPELRPLIDLRTRPNYRGPSLADGQGAMTDAPNPTFSLARDAGTGEDGRISTH